MVHDDRPSVREVGERLSGTDVAIVEWSELPAAVFKLPSMLKHVVMTSTGFGRVDIGAARESGVSVSTTPGYCSESVAEFAFRQMLCIARPDCSTTLSLDAEDGPADVTRLPLGQQLAGSNLGIIGLGRIGSAVAHKGWAFGMNVTAFTRSAIRMPFVRHLPLHELLSSSDFLAVCLTGGASTAGLLSGDVLRHIRQGSIIVSICGGQVFDESALQVLLQAGTVRGVAIDGRPDELLDDHPRLLQTADVAWYTEQAAENNLREVIMTVGDAIAGIDRNVVN